MIDKEITIDCVDVCECEFYYHKFCTLQSNRYEKLPSVKICSKYEFCKYKQLKRKEQECEKLDNEAQNLFTEKINLENELDQLRAENEELKKKFKKFFDIDNQECWDIAFLNNEKERYKQALDEIEKVLINGVYDEFGRPLYEDDIIRNIIKKAKDGE